MRGRPAIQILAAGTLPRLRDRNVDPEGHPAHGYLGDRQQPLLDPELTCCIGPPWSPYASDYSRYLPEGSSLPRAAVLTFLGSGIASF